MSAPDSGMDEDVFVPRKTVHQVEEGALLAPKFGSDGMMPVVTTDAASGEVLMMGVITSQALTLTIETGEAQCWSRSRRRLWRKGATSGLIQKVVEIRIDDDQNAVWLRVEIAGGASCHVGHRSCFHRAVPREIESRPNPLVFTESEKVFDPKDVYGDAPTQRSSRCAASSGDGRSVRPLSNDGLPA